MRHNQEGTCCAFHGEMARRNALLYSVPGHRTSHLLGLPLTDPAVQLALLFYHLPDAQTTAQSS